jgi:hypothetical protein
MAFTPPEPPETLIVGTFAGIRNTVSRERLAKGELETAVNVDIDDAGQLRRRRGYVQRSNAVCHSLTTLGDTTLVVKDGVLGRLYPDYSFQPIVPVGPEPLCYSRVGDMIYYSSSVTSGKISADNIPLTWGALVGDQWISPVIRPTETLGAIRGKLLGGPPRATSMESYKGRLYLGHERLIWATELYQYDLVDKTKNFLQFEADLTMIAAVDDGLYVGTTMSLLFLEGVFGAGMKLTTVLNAPVVPGSQVVVPYAKAMPQARSGPVPEGFGPMFMTGQGIVVGLNGGQAYNLTQDHVVFPGAVRAAALYREDQGANAYVAVADSAGGPVANARIGDYVDAEIIRASQRG